MGPVLKRTLRVLTQQMVEGGRLTRRAEGKQTQGKSTILGALHRGTLAPDMASLGFLKTTEQAARVSACPSGQ